MGQCTPAALHGRARLALRGEPANCLCVGSMRMPHAQWGNKVQHNADAKTIRLAAGAALQDGMPVDAELHATLLAMIKQMNQGVYTLKDIVVAQA